ncbi:hypothetical protein ABZ490_32030 [Streptomyces sp. NPDC005811]|uniref:hypothetical protein n=1 Tax=Streptomyces sp. NPDC005811 TaxID=3154565 RepID=UPI0033C1E55C
MAGTAVDDTQGETGRLWAAPRGRHRRPRPRKVLFAAGGLALAAGVLSLVRLSSGPSGVTGIGTAEAEPHVEPPVTRAGSGSGTDRTAGTGATVAPTPTAPSPMGGASAEPAPEVSLVPGTPGTPTSVALTPSASYVPAHTPAPAPTRGTTPRPTPPPPRAPAPTATATPAPPTRQPGVCVPVVGLCVNALNVPSGL